MRLRISKEIIDKLSSLRNAVVVFSKDVDINETIFYLKTKLILKYEFKFIREKLNGDKVYLIYDASVFTLLKFKNYIINEEETLSIEETDFSIKITEINDENVFEFSIPKHMIANTLYVTDIDNETGCDVPTYYFLVKKTVLK